MNPTNERRVLVQDADGRYLAGHGTEWYFTEDRSKAAVFNYYRDHVAEQVQLANRAYGTSWVVTQLAAREVDEICDHCGNTERPSMVFYTGHEFLCRACHSPVQPPHQVGGESEVTPNSQPGVF